MYFGSNICFATHFILQIFGSIPRFSYEVQFKSYYFIRIELNKNYNY